MATGTRVDMSGTDLVINNLYTGATSGSGSGTGGGTLMFSGANQVNATETFAAGTATSAPITMTAGTNLTTATAGTVEYDGKAFYATAVANSRQLMDTEQFILQNGDSTPMVTSGLDSSSASAVFTSPTSGQITLASNTAYAFEGLYNLTNTGTTSHTWSTLFALSTSASLSGISYQVTGLSTGTANTPATGGLSGFVSTAGAAVVTAASTSATEQVSVFLTGVVRVATTGGGTFTPQLKASARPGASGTAGVVVKDGSFFRIWPLGVQTVTNVGNWS